MDVRKQKIKIKNKKFKTRGPRDTHLTGKIRGMRGLENGVHDSSAMTTAQEPRVSIIHILSDWEIMRITRRWASAISLPIKTELVFAPGQTPKPHETTLFRL